MFKAIGAAVDTKEGLVAFDGLPGFQIAECVHQLSADFGNDLYALIGLCGSKAIEIQPQVFADNTFGLHAQRKSLGRLALWFFSHIDEETHGHHAKNEDKECGDGAPQDA